MAPLTKDYLSSKSLTRSWVSNDRLIAVVALGALSIGFLSGCGKEEANYVEVQEVQADPHAGHDHAAAPAVEAPERELGFTHTLPEGWVEKPASSMVLLSLQSGTSPHELVNVAVSAFPGEVGGQLANINRWRRQIGMGPIEADAMAAMVKLVTIAGMDAWQVDLTGEGDVVRMVVSAVFHDGKTWFVKMTGSSEAVSGQLASYQFYIESIKF